MDPLTAFLDRFGEKPAWVASAPGRVNLIGEHTDYNDGFVLPMAIERRTVVAAAPWDEPVATIYSRLLDETVTIPLTGAISPGPPQWANYARGVIAGFQRVGDALRGFRAVVVSDVPAGSGLSSSAAFEVALATLIETMTAHQLSPVAKALLCQRAEREFAGVPTGIMDQLTAVCATKDHALLIDCRSLVSKPIPIADPSVTVLIINTNVRHDLAEGEYARRRRECEEAAIALGVPALRDVAMRQLAPLEHTSPLLFRRARHVVSENDRTLRAAEALRRRDWSAMAELMYASHSSLRHDFEVSCAELDAVVEIAEGIGDAGGVFGCRMTGGGFGGSAVALVRSDRVTAVSATIAERYLRCSRRKATIFATRPAGGAGAISAE